MDHVPDGGALLGGADRRVVLAHALGQVESEMRAVERDFVTAEEPYSRDTLSLQLARAYLKTLLENARVAKYLGQRHGEVLAQLRHVVEMSSLDA